MKLRLQGNSIRLRLGRGEVQSLLTEGTVQCATDFPLPSQRLVYSISTDAGAKSMRAAFIGGELRVVIPAATAKQWATTDQVGMSHDDGPVSLLVEKDFACLDRREREDEDAFENPLAGKSC